jgi:hypothetical protein
VEQAQPNPLEPLRDQLAALVVVVTHQPVMVWWAALELLTLAVAVVGATVLMVAQAAQALSSSPTRTFTPPQQLRQDRQQ